jgi:hypothetical protein
MANGRYRVLHHPAAGRQQRADVPCPNNYTSPIPGIPASAPASASALPPSHASAPLLCLCPAPSSQLPPHQPFTLL